MKKNYFLLFAMLFVWQINAQVLNQNAAWPNAAWSVTGTYNTNPLAFEANPTTSVNFAWDDDDAGNTSIDNIAAESPVIDLTAAVTAGETKVRVSAMYTYRILAGYLRLEYWDADAAAWTPWGADLVGNNTTVTNNFCTPAKTMYTSEDLDVAAFTATQLSGFRYRIAFDDLDWEWGFCFDSPTIISVPVPCLSGFNFPATTVTPGACDGFTPTIVSDFSWAGDYFTVAVTAGETYKFTSSVATDFFTISTDGDLTAAASGTQPLSWVSTVTGNIRVHINTDILCGTQDVDRTTSVICGTLCLTGGLYPGETLTPTNCDGTTVNVLIDDAWAGEYSNIEVFAANTYTFSSSVATDYITLTSEDGLTALAVGTGSVAGFTPAANGIIRFYLHADSSCGTENLNRERQVVCTTAAVLPGCVTNPSPADGSTTAPAFSDLIFTWDAPTTGDPAVSYNFYGGTAPGNLVLFGNTTTTSFNAGTVGAYEFTGYWQVLAVNAAGESVGCAEWMFTTESQPTDTPDYVALQWPPTLSFTQGGSGTVYGQVYEAGLTDNTTGQAPGILAWVGISDEGDNSDPSGWTNWVPATFNNEQGNNDEYQANIGTALAPGTYYYATRFTLNGGPFVYGGINASNQGNFWDGTTYNSGVLTVTPAPAPANDECSGAIALTPGGVFADNDIDSSNIGATLSAQTPNPTCGAFNFATDGKDVWYSVVVPASGSLTIETSTTAVGGAGMDTVIQVYSGDCNALATVGCDDDGSPETTFGLTRLALTGQTPGATLLLRLFGYNGSTGSFAISAFDASLANSSFDNSSFTYYPNPVKNVLNLSYSQEITNVEVYNLLGQRMSTNTIGANQGQVDMSNLANGTYLVKVTADNQVKTIKVIKE